MYGIDPKYQEILKLDEMLTEANIPHVLDKMFDGWQICYPTTYSEGGCVMDAVEHHGSYGNSEDLLEIMGLLTPEEEDDVLGYLTAADVFKRIQTHYNRTRPKVIAVDFDGTLCMNKWPDIGAPYLDLINRLKELRRDGHKVILWTCRERMRLVEAVAWCSGYGLFFDAVNDNIKEYIDHFGSNSRKILADIYIDDKAMRPDDMLKSIDI